MKLLTSKQIEALLASWLSKTKLSNQWQSAMVAIGLAAVYYMLNGQVISIEGLATAIIAGIFSYLTTSANAIVAKSEGKVEGKIEIVQELVEGKTILNDTNIDEFASKEPQPYQPIGFITDKKTEKLNKGETNAHTKT